MIVTINDNNVLKTFNILDSSAIADVFDSTQSYVIGDYCVYGNTLYKFVENHNAGAWSSSDVTQVFITDELASLRLDISQKYEKPSGGIPASDLASAVQTSLGKADTALQTAPTPDWNAASGANGYIDNKPNIRQGTDTNHTAVIEGVNTTASGVYSHAEGAGTQATGDYSHAEGGGSYATANYAHAEGAGATASGAQSHAEGGGTTAQGSTAHAEGGATTASGTSSHAEGGSTTASGTNSHAEGSWTTASGEASHAGGYYTVANHRSQYTFGEYNIADSSSGAGSLRGNYVEIVGNGTFSARSNARTLDWSGNEVLAGKLTVGAAPTNNMDVATKQYVDDEVGAKYEKPSGGIPDTDLSSAVQASLGKADTALQSAPVTSVNTKTGAVTLDADDIGYDDTETYTTGTVGDTISTLSSDLSNKLDTPSTAGASGQILTSDGHGGQIWEDALSGVDAIGDGTVTLIEAGSDIIKTASTSTADLDVSDSSGNVLVRFENGHIKTKEFDSSEIVKIATASGVDAIGDGIVTIVEAGSDIIKTASTSTADLDISDSSGNVLARFEGGHIKTKEFDSSEIVKIATASTADLDVSDTSGNVLVRFKDGNIETKAFDSSDVYPLKGKKWACVGDSLTEANVRTTLHYHDYIAELTGLNVVNMGHSGAGYYARSFDYAFMNEVQNVPTDSDIVTIFGGGNDIGQISLGNVTDTTSSTLCGCVNITLDNLFTRLPIAYVGVITPTPWYQATGPVDWTPSNHGNDLEEYCEAIVEICRRRSIPCLDLYHMSNLRPQEASFRQLAYSKDDGNGVHPDETGHRLIAARFMEFIRSIILC